MNEPLFERIAADGGPDRRLVPANPDWTEALAAAAPRWSRRGWRARAARWRGGATAPAGG
jgi:hypothetical protein